MKKQIEQTGAALLTLAVFLIGGVFLTNRSQDIGKIATSKPNGEVKGSTTVTKSPVADTYATSQWASSNYGGINISKTGYENPGPGTYYYHQSYMKFDLSSIPSSATITSANLKLKLWIGATCYGTSGLNAYKVYSSWGENTLTWNNKPSYWSTPISMNLSCGGSSYKSTDVTSFVQQWVNGTKTNNGFMFKGSYSGASWLRMFYTREVPTADARPVLEITYTVPDTPAPPAPAPAETPSTDTSSGSTTTTTTTSTPAAEETTVATPKLTSVTVNDKDAKTSDTVEVNQDDSVKITGTAPAGSTVMVTVGDQTFDVKADSSGNWSLTLDESKLKEGLKTVSAQTLSSDGKISEKVVLFDLKVNTKVAAAKTEAKKSNYLPYYIAAGVLLLLLVAGIVTFIILHNRKKKKVEDAQKVEPQEEAVEEATETESIPEPEVTEEEPAEKPQVDTVKKTAKKAVRKKSKK